MGQTGTVPGSSPAAFVYASHTGAGALDVFEGCSDCFHRSKQNTGAGLWVGAGPLWPEKSQVASWFSSIHSLPFKIITSLDVIT